MGGPDEDKVLFREEQRFTSRWLWGLVITTSALSIGMAVHSSVQQLVLGRPWGNRPLSDGALMVVATVWFVFGIGLLWLFAVARLTTEVRSNGLFLRFFPFHLHFKQIALDHATCCEARQYRPIREYGGWGIRIRHKGRAYNVNGHWGVRLDYDNGRHVLIGSARADELAAAIQILLRRDWP